MKPTILVVDDQPGTRQLLRNVLEREGYRVVEASDEGDAWWAIQRCDQALELALIDVDLPGRDGRCVADHLQLLQPLPVIFMSGHDRNVLLAEGRLQRDASWLAKPFRLSEVRETVRRELRAGHHEHRVNAMQPGSSSAGSVPEWPTGAEPAAHTA